MRTAIQELAYKNVRLQHPAAKEGGMNAEMRKILDREYGGGFAKDEYDKAHFVPDLYEIDSTINHIKLLEIEDTHPIKSQKLDVIIDWFSNLDNIEAWGLELIVFDRYGLTPRKILEF